MNRKSECSFLTRTNRQFYMRRKKSPDEISELKLGRVLKSLVSKNATHRSSKPKKLTEMCQDLSKSKLNDKNFELLDSLRELEYNLKKTNPIFGKLVQTFEKCISSDSTQLMESFRLNFYELLNQTILVYGQKARNFQQGVDSDTKAKVSKQNALYLENLKLEKQNMMLRNQINYGLPQSEQNQKQRIREQITKSRTAKYIESIKSTAVNQQFLTNVVMMERKLEVATQQIEIMKREADNLKEELFLMRDEKKSLKQRILELKIKNQNLCSEIIGLQLKNKKMGVSDDRREAIMMMQFEEIQSYRYQISELKKLYIGLSKKYKGLILKFKKTVADGNKIGAIYTRQATVFPEQLQAFEEVRGKVHPSIRIHLVANKERRMEKMQMYQECFGVRQTMNNKEGVKKLPTIGYQYCHPSFYAFIAQDVSFFGIDQSNFEHFNQTIKLNFIGTARAILDCKFNEFVLNRSNGLVCSFPSFVLAWLNTYQLSESKRVEKIGSSNTTTTREAVCTFYINLMSSKLNYSWEIIAFREFLLETFNNDELYFYLNLRYLLVGGDITNDLSFCFQEIYYVDFNRCFAIVSKVIKQNDFQSKQIYEEFLKRASVTIRKKCYLDMHYVLRIMLEYYQGLKQKQVDSLLKTLDVLVQGNKQNIGFLDFLKIFDHHFMFLSFTETIELFRKCFCAGNGTVTAEVIIATLNQENVFLRWVETLINNNPIRIEQLRIGEEDSFVITPNLDWIYENQKTFRFILNSQLLRQTQRLGIQRLSNDTSKLSKLTSHSIHSRLEMCFSVCMLVSKKFYLSGLVSNNQLGEALQLASEFMGSFSKVTICKNEIMEIMRYLKQKTAVQKIAKFYHKKKAEMTRSILYAYSSNQLSDKCEHKNEVLRTQFMQIIEEAKVRKKESSKPNIQEI